MTPTPRPAAEAEIETVSARALLVSSDRQCRTRFRRLLRPFPWISVQERPSAPDLGGRRNPDVVFLDLGDFRRSARAVCELGPPLLVCIARSAKGAFDAFLFDAFDCLPLDCRAPRFARTMERVSRRLRARSAERPSAETYLLIRRGPDLVPLRASDIIRFESAGDYVLAYSREGAVVLSATLARLHEKVGAAFVRLHRSHLVNLGFVRRFRRHDKKRLEAVLSEGTTLVASRSKSRELRGFGL